MTIFADIIQTRKKYFAEFGIVLPRKYQIRKQGN